MYRKIEVNAEHNEIILENSHGDKVIIPANKRNWVKQKLSEGCHGCIDSLVETLPVASQYAQDGSVYPDGTRVKVNQDNQIKEYDISSPEYKDLYNSGKLMSYDKNSNTYISTPLKEVTVTAEAPQWLKDKRQFEKEYSKDRFIDEAMPKFSRSMGISSTNMNPNNVAEYDKIINDKVVENIFKRKPAFDTDYSNDRLKTLQGFTQKELELIKNSSYSIKIEPSIWSKFEQGLLSVGNAGSPVAFKNPSLSQEEAKKEDNPLNILQPLSIPSKMIQSAYKDDYSFTDALKGKKNNAGIVEDIITDPLNLVGVGLVGKLSKADKVIDATKVGSKVLNKTDDVIKSTVYNEGENKVLDFFTPKNTKKVSSEFTFENIPDRKFNTLNDFKTKYKSDYQVATDKRTFKGEPLDITKTGKEESNYFTRNIDDKIEKHYNNEITLQKFKDYGGDEKLFQTLIDNINTPSKTVPGSLNNASGLLTDEGVSLAVHNKYLDSDEAMQTLFHEKGHQSKIVASTKEESLLPNLWEDISKLSGYSKYTAADKGSIGMYMSHPSEIYSRIMELKYKANLKPYENFTKELLEKIGGVERDASGKIIKMSGLMPSSYSKNEVYWLKLINKAPVLIPAIMGSTYLQSKNQNKLEQ